MLRFLYGSGKFHRSSNWFIPNMLQCKDGHSVSEKIHEFSFKLIVKIVARTTSKKTVASKS
jgi:hypothetical protein